MKKEFLQNFKIGDQPLSNEVIEAILAENQRDIDSAVDPYKDYDSIKEQLATAKETLKKLDGVDVKELQGKIASLQSDLSAKESEYKSKLESMAFDRDLEQAISSMHGRSVKAITAMLDLDALKASKNRTADIKGALEGVQKEHGYLFDDGKTPPPYSSGAGSGGGGSYDSDAALRAAMGLPAQKN